MKLRPRTKSQASKQWEASIKKALLRGALSNTQKLAFIKANCDVVNGCWLWRGNRYGGRYARMSYKASILLGVPTRVHIAVYILVHGKPSKPFVCHTCDIKHCCKPKHLWEGTNQENQIDAVHKGVFARFWTEAKRAEKSSATSGSNNPMYGRRGAIAPCYGRTGSRHPMFGKHHTPDSKRKTSISLLKFYQRKSQ